MMYRYPSETSRIESGPSVKQADGFKTTTPLGYHLSSSPDWDPYAGHPLKRPPAIHHTSTLSKIMYQQQQNQEYVLQQKQVVWDVPPKKRGILTAFSTLNISLRQMFCPPVVHDYDISIMGAPDSVTSSSSSSNDSLLAAEPNDTDKDKVSSSETPLPENKRMTETWPRPAAVARRSSAPVVMRAARPDSFSSESSSIPGRHRRTNTTISGSLDDASSSAAAELIFHRDTSNLTGSVTIDNNRNKGSITPHHHGDMSPLTVVESPLTIVDSPPTVPQQQDESSSDDTVDDSTGSDYSDDESLVMDSIAPSTTPTILEECTPDEAPASPASVSSESWATTALDDLQDDEALMIPLAETGHDHVPVYLPKCPLFENQLLKQNPQASVCVSGWVAFSTQRDKSVISKIRHSSIKKKHLAYLVLLSQQPTLYLFQCRSGNNNNKKRRFVLKIIELSRGATVETKSVNPQCGQAIVVSAPTLHCTVVPVALGPACFQQGSQQSILENEEQLDAALSSCNKSSSRHWDNFAPIEQHEAVMHIRFALDCLVRGAAY